MHYLSGHDIARVGRPLFYDQVQIHFQPTSGKGASAHPVAGERIRAGRAGEQGLQALGDQVRQQVPPIRRHGHPFSILDDVIVLVQIDIRVWVRWKADAKFL